MQQVFHAAKRRAANEQGQNVCIEEKEGEGGSKSVRVKESGSSSNGRAVGSRKISLVESVGEVQQEQQDKLLMVDQESPS